MLLSTLQSKHKSPEWLAFIGSFCRKKWERWYSSRNLQGNHTVPVPLDLKLVASQMGRKTTFVVSLQVQPGRSSLVPMPEAHLMSTTILTAWQNISYLPWIFTHWHKMQTWMKWKSLSCLGPKVLCCRRRDKDFVMFLWSKVSISAFTSFTLKPHHFHKVWPKSQAGMFLFFFFFLWTINLFSSYTSSQFPWLLFNLNFVSHYFIIRHLD